MDEQLFAAIASKNLSQVEELLAAGADANARRGGKSAYEAVPHGADDIKCALIEAGAEDPEIKHSLVWVLLTGRVKAVQTLIAKGADLNVKTYSGSPLQAAARGGYTEIVELLIAAGADVDYGNTIGTPLLSAIEQGHTDIALKLIAAGANPNLTSLFGHVPPIATAAAQGCPILIGALLDAGADANTFVPNIRARETMALDTFPVIIAARLGHAEALASLLEAGADPYRRDGEGLSAYDRARQNTSTDVLKVLVRFGVKEISIDVNQELLLAAEKGDVDGVRDCLQRGAQVNWRDSRRQTKNRTTLMLAAKGGHLPVVEMLLNAGADPNLTDSPGEVKNNFRSLLEHTGPETIESMGYTLGRTALMVAAATGETDIVKTLLRGGADPNHKDNLECTTLNLAVVNKQADAVRALVAGGADVNAPGTYGSTPFLLACEQGAIEIARFLIDAGADVTVRDRNGDTAVSLAELYGRREILSLLQDYSNPKSVMRRISDGVRF